MAKKEGAHESMFMPLPFWFSVKKLELQVVAGLPEFHKTLVHMGKDAIRRKRGEQAFGVNVRSDVKAARVLADKWLPPTTYSVAVNFNSCGILFAQITIRDQG